jgi:diguanylate cyclase (GGDEF)-like protein
LVDNLTGLRNRRFGENLLKTKLWEVGGGGSPFGMLFFDIDFFKLINDKYGHNVGDEVLKSLCNTLFSGLRASDILVRWGGEEIVAILPGEVSFSQLQKVADKIRLLVEKSSHLTSEGALYVTISVGGTLSLYGDTVQSIVKRVDKLMYQSKAKGRNCVTVG